MPSVQKRSKDSSSKPHHKRTGHAVAGTRRPVTMPVRPSVVKTVHKIDADGYIIGRTNSKGQRIHINSIGGGRKYETDKLTGQKSARPAANLPSKYHKKVASSSRSKALAVQRENVGGMARSKQLDYADLAPWERQQGETPEAYAAFCVYRDMGPLERGYDGVCKKYGLSKTIAQRHGSNHHWVERAAAWDFHIDRCRLASTEQYQIEMAARHAEIAKKMLLRVSQRLDRIDFKKLDPKTTAAWLDVGVKVERLSRGLNPAEAADRLNKVAVTIRHMTDQEIISEISREGRQGERALLSAGEAVIDVPTPAGLNGEEKETKART